MGTVVNLDPDVEELLRRDARNRNVEFDRALNDAVRASLSRTDQGRRFEQKTYSMRAMDDPKKLVTELDELDDLERLRNMRLADTR